ncbi:MAG TPA: hypothetical protein VKR42_10495 [Ktedonobacteraceae bacterium]|nr:hypothetical protein [Ktedonobacteraceae bacterium]
MNCEQVEEQLSAYLDNMLVLGETAASANQLHMAVTAHLQGCLHCSNILADYRRIDTLLSAMPRVSPSPALRNRIFSSPEYLELTGTSNAFDSNFGKNALRTSANNYTRRDTPGRPQLVALPGGRHASSSTAPTAKYPLPRQELHISELSPRHRSHRGLRIMQVAIVAVVLLTLGVGGLIGWNAWQQQNATANMGAITPPAGPPGHGPLSAGMRFVFLRNGVLWSAPTDGSSPAQQLTSSHVVVADNWAVSPPLPGRNAGDMLAYIDLQHAYVHIIRSDGQRDAQIRQPLLETGIQPSSVWDTTTGDAILNSLAWSKDGSMLSFVADPRGTGLASLYIYSIGTGTVQAVPLPVQGSVAYPVWSPDGIRIAFELNSHGVESILGYNTQNHGLLTISSAVATSANPHDTVQTLNWSPDAFEPAITWSVGQIGNVHSIWLRHVGVGGTPTSQVIVTGNYTQAVYSSSGHGDAGSWLLVTSSAGQIVTLWRVDVTPGALPVVLASGKQLNVAQWSPDGTYIEYLTSVISGVGSLHVINTVTGTDTPIASGVASEPLPAWSSDGQSLVYNTGMQIVVVSIQASRKPFMLKLQGPATSFIWSLTSPSQLVVAVSDGQQGIYLVDTRNFTTQQLDQHAMSGTVLWTQVP